MNFEEFFDAAEDMRKYGELIKREFDSRMIYIMDVS